MKEYHLLINYDPSRVYAFFSDFYLQSHSSFLESMACDRTSISMTRCELPLLSMRHQPQPHVLTPHTFMGRELMVLYYRLPTGETDARAQFTPGWSRNGTTPTSLDFLAILACVGVVVSEGITIVVCVQSKPGLDRVLIDLCRSSSRARSKPKWPKKIQCASVGAACTCTQPLAPLSLHSERGTRPPRTMPCLSSQLYLYLPIHRRDMFTCTDTVITGIESAATMRGLCMRYQAMTGSRSETGTGTSSRVASAGITTARTITTTGPSNSNESRGSGIVNPWRAKATVKPRGGSSFPMILALWWWCNRIGGRTMEMLSWAGWYHCLGANLRDIIGRRGEHTSTIWCIIGGRR